MAIFPTGSGVFLKKESQRIGRRFVGPVSPGQPGPAPSMTPRWRRKRPIPPCALFWFTNAMQMWYTLMGHSYSLPAASVFPRLWAAPPTTTTMTTLGHYNPLRYRGYVYDAETGFYYLNSRYYNPTWGRFINADGQLNDGIFGNNLFSYCLNNPVNMSDYEGNVPDWINKAAKWVKEKIIQPIKRIFSPNKKSNLPNNYMLYKEHQKREQLIHPTETHTKKVKLEKQG